MKYLTLIYSFLIVGEEQQTIGILFAYLINVPIACSDFLSGSNIRTDLTIQSFLRDLHFDLKFFVVNLKGHEIQP